MTDILVKLYITKYYNKNICKFFINIILKEWNMKKTIGRRALIITLVAALLCIAAAEGIVLIRDICADKENRAYLSQITPDYKASVSDIEEVSNKYVRPMSSPNYSISDDGYDLQNYLRYLNIGDAWQNYLGDGVTVAVIDTDIDTYHPNLLLSKCRINIKMFILCHIEKLQKSRRKISNISQKALTRDL